MNTNKKIKTMRFIGMVLIAAIIIAIPAFASADFGKQGGEWILDQIFWVGLVVAAIILIKFFLAGNFTKMLITAAVAAVTLVVVDDPQRLKILGDTIWTTVFKV